MAAIWIGPLQIRGLEVRKRPVGFRPRIEARRLRASQSTGLALHQHVVPHTERAQHLVAEATLAPGACEPGVEAASRDTERPPHQIDRSGPPVFRYGAEPHIDSFAK